MTHKPTSWASQPGGASSATFSPDGRLIAYEWGTSRTDGELRLIGTDGTGERTLYRNPNAFGTTLLDWSPDGSRILVNLWMNDNTEQLVLISTADGSVQLPGIPGGTHFQRVLLDAAGDGLVFTTPKPENAGTEIHRLSFAGVESTLVASVENTDSVIGWSPDRHRLIFSSDRRGQTRDLVRFRFEPGSRRRAAGTGAER